MKKTTTIQISVYDWQLKGELIYEAQIECIEELLALSYKFGKKAKYKKPTDKNWYYNKTMVRRLFKKKLSDKEPLLKLVTINDLDKSLEELQKAKEEKEAELRERLKERIKEKSRELDRLNTKLVILEMSDF